MNETTIEWPTEQIKTICSQCRSVLELTRYQRTEQARPPTPLVAQETEQFCPVCGALAKTLGLSITLLSEYPAEEIEVMCSQCSSTLQLTRYVRTDVIKPPEYGETEQYCPVCSKSVGIGFTLEVTQAKPWPPEEPPKPPIAGVLGWSKKHWPYLLTGGILLSGLIIWGLRKK